MTQETSFSNRGFDMNENAEDGLFASDPEIADRMIRERPSTKQRSIGRSLSRLSARRRVAPAEESHVDTPDLFSNSYGTFQNPVDEHRPRRPHRILSTADEDHVISIEPVRIKNRLTFQERIEHRITRAKETVDEKLSVFHVSKSLECYGGGVFSYFSFVAWLGKVNFFTLLLYVGAIVLPYALIDRGKNFRDFLVDYNLQPNQSAFLNRCSIEYINNLNNYTESRPELLDKVLDGFQGTGWFALLDFIFIGQYFDKIFWRHDKYLSVRYNTSLAFYLCLWTTLCILLLLTVISSGKRVLERVSSREDESPYTFKVLARWDYIVRDRRRAHVEKVSIVNELTKELAEDDRRQRKENMSAGDKRKLYGTRVAVWIVYIIITAGYLTGIYFVNKVTTEQATELAKDKGTSAIILFAIQYATSVYIVIFNFVIEQLCKLVVGREEYNANMEIYITIIRTVFLRFIALVVLMGSMFILLTKCHLDNEMERCVEKDCENLQCWETYVGQQIYKLVLLDFIIFIGVCFLDLFRKIVIARCIKKIGRAEFDISKNVIDLIYSQALCWLGMFFCPFLPVVLFVKIVLTYIFKKLCVYYDVYEHDKKSTNASQTDSYFLDTLLFVIIVVIFFPLGVATSVFGPSRSCGPYRQYFATTDQLKGHRIALSSVLDMAFNRLGAEAKKAYEFIDSFIVMSPIWIILLFVTYYYFSMSKAHNRLIKHLRLEMVHEMQDQAYLQRRALESKKALLVAQAAHRA